VIWIFYLPSHVTQPIYNFDCFYFCLFLCPETPRLFVIVYVAVLFVILEKSLCGDLMFVVSPFFRTFLVNQKNQKMSVEVATPNTSIKILKLAYRAVKMVLNILRNLLFLSPR